MSSKGLAGPRVPWQKELPQGQPLEATMIEVWENEEGHRKQGDEM